MLRKLLPILILSLTALLTAAAVRFVPESLYFPVVDYTTPEELRIRLLKSGELAAADCEQGLAKVENAIRANCPKCEVAARCIRGLDSERRAVLSREPLMEPSVRTADSKLAMTFSAKDPQLALAVCQASALHSTSQSPDLRMHCYPAHAPR